jgi:hypothetical protein
MLSNHPCVLGGNTGSSSGSPGGAVAADDVTVADAGGYYTGTEAEAVLQEVGAELDALNMAEPRSPTGNYLISGGNVAADGGLVIVAGASNYVIQGTAYTSAQTTLTAAAADPTNPRIDVVALNSSGAAVLITGTPAATPLKPDVDPVTQLELTFVLVAAAATAVTANIVDVYRENTEYTMTESGTSINLASASNPRSGSTDIEGTAVPAGDYFRAQAPGTLNLADYDNLIFFIRSKASWPGAKQLSITARSSGAIIGQTIVFKSGTYGFDSSVTGSYQLITIPTSLFGANGQSINQLQWTCAGGGSTIGFYVDDISLQGGLAAITDSSRMLWRGVYSSTVLYNINDTVLSSGIQYVCIQAGQGKTPVSNTAYWQPSSAAGGGAEVLETQVFS